MSSTTTFALPIPRSTVFVMQLETPSTSPQHTGLTSAPPKRQYKTHVHSACVECKKAHVACDVSRPCKRCVAGGKAETCRDAKHKKRGRPKRQDIPVILPTKQHYEQAYPVSKTQQQLEPERQQRQFSFIQESTPEESVVSQEQQALRDPEPPPASEDIVLLLTTDLHCARASDSVALWGYHPLDLAHRSMYILISEHDSDRLSRLHQLLIESIKQQQQRQRNQQTLPSTASVFQSVPPTQLVHAAPGSKTYSDTLRIEYKHGGHELYRVLLYLGGGLGANMISGDHLDKLYIVAELRKHQYQVEYVPQQQPPIPSSPSSLPHPNTHAPVSQPPPPPLSLPPTTSTPPSSYHPYPHSHPHPHPASLSRNSGNLHRDVVARQGTLPGHFQTNSRLHTVSLSPNTGRSTPKINIAPMTQKQSSDQPYFRPIRAARPSPAAQTNQQEMLAYKFIPAPSQPTHPTLQYFLQTSSSALNAAASAAQQGDPKRGPGAAQPDAKEVTPSPPSQPTITQYESRTDKAKAANAPMSIRSLLC